MLGTPLENKNPDTEIDLNKPNRILAKVALGSLFAMVTQVAAAAVIIDNTTQGLYNSGLGTLLDTNGVNDPFPCANVACGDSTLNFPTAPNLANASAQLGNWLTTPATPGGTWSAAPQAIPVTWAANTESAIIYLINAGLGLANFVLSIGVDNGIFVWLDGNYVGGNRAAGGAVTGEHTFNLGALGAGTHYLQLLREDHGGSTGYIVSASADRVVNQTPEPASLAVFAIGLLSLGFALRRRA